jgi:anthranilate phosphoribosyltransferase
MAIAHYIKEIGRGKEGARSLTREQAADLMTQVLAGGLSDLEIGAFCIAMRIKGETPEELAGFLDATHAQLAPVTSGVPVVVIPSYNGARKLAGLTALLSALLARAGAERGFAVLVHGSCSETKRVPTADVLKQLYFADFDTNMPDAAVFINKFATNLVANDQPHYLSTEQLCPPLEKLLQVRRTVGLRNSAHSVVKLMNPVRNAPALLVTSYTHPEYLQSMTQTLQLTGGHAMLLRGTEGEAVADARRRPRMDGFVHGQPVPLCEQQEGSLHSLPELPTSCEAASTAAYTRAVLAGEKPVPAPIAAQVEHILLLVSHLLSQLPTEWKS